VKRDRDSISIIAHHKHPVKREIRRDRLSVLVSLARVLEASGAVAVDLDFMARRAEPQGSGLLHEEFFNVTCGKLLNPTAADTDQMLVAGFSQRRLVVGMSLGVDHLSDQISLEQQVKGTIDRCTGNPTLSQASSKLLSIKMAVERIDLVKNSHTLNGRGESL
jgi:hypothetical protein